MLFIQREAQEVWSKDLECTQKPFGYRVVVH